MSENLANTFRTYIWLMVLHDDEDDAVWDSVNDFLSDVMEAHLTPDELNAYRREVVHQREPMTLYEESSKWLKENPEWSPLSLMSLN